MGTMGKIRIGTVLVVVLKLVAVCLAEKDPTLSLRPPSSSSPVFSSSIDSIPVVSASSQQSVYSKRPNSVHSTVASSVSSSSGDQATSGGRNNNPWYAPGNTFSFDFNGGSGGDLNSAGASSHSTSSASSGGGYYEHPPAQAASPSTPSDSYSPPSNAPGQPSYTYFYQHYPTSSGSGHGWSNGGEEGGHGDLFGGLSLPNFQLPAIGGGSGLAGLGGVGGLKILKAIAKGILVVKPFLILGLLLLIALPILFLLLPIPIITITSQPSMLRAARSSKIGTYLTELSGKVLNAEECLERIICKLPHAPEKFQSRVKLVWDEYGSRMVANERVARGLNAYFETSSQKNKNLKCNQRFKCSNKYL